jgi:hypothetical protein
VQHGADEGHHGIGGRSLTNQVALFTAVISTVGAMFSYMGGVTQAYAMLYKNDSQIRKTEASNQWNYYQSKSSKQNLSELASELVSTPEKKAYYAKEIERYKAEKDEIKLAADKLEAEAVTWDKRSDEQLHQHHRWAQATTIIQVSIALAAIALLTKKKWLEWLMFGVGGGGIVVGILASLHV